jgi:hypothetical protein
MLRTPHGLFGHFNRHTGEFVENSAGLDNCDPTLRRRFAFSHSRLCGFLRERLIREDLNPDFPTSPNVSGDRDTRGLDLPIRDPSWFDRLESVFAKRDLVTTRRGALHPAPVLLSELHASWHQHCVRSS